MTHRVLLCLLEVPEVMCYCATLLAGGARGVGGAEGDAMCAVLLAGGVGDARAVLCMLDVVRCLLRSLMEVLDVVDVMHCVLLSLPEVMRRVLFCALEAVDGEPCLLEELEMMLCMLLCTLEAVGGRPCSLEVLEAMRCMLLRMLDAVEGVPSFRVSIFPL